MSPSAELVLLRSRARATPPPLLACENAWALSRALETAVAGLGVPARALRSTSCEAPAPAAAEGGGATPRRPNHPGRWAGTPRGYRGTCRKLGHTRGGVKPNCEARKRPCGPGGGAAPPPRPRAARYGAG